MQRGRVAEGERDTRTLEERLDTIEEGLVEIREGLAYATILVGLLLDED